MCALGISPTPKSSTDVPVLYRDEHLIIVNKPAGVPAQPDPSGDPSVPDLLETALGVKLGIPHRLDRPVSGTMLLTLNDSSLAAISGMFRSRDVRRTYWAIVEGEMPLSAELRGVLQHDARARKARVTMDPLQDGSAMLRSRRLVQGDRYALVEVEPEGGAFHQIRALLAAGGNPIRGDVKYGARRGEKDRSIALHSRRIVLHHPLLDLRVDVVAPTPERPIWNALCTKADLRDVEPPT